MKLKTIIFLQESAMSMGYGSLSSLDSGLYPLPGSIDDVQSWDGIIESSDGKWFLYKESNDWHKKQAGASVTITEGKPHRFNIKIKTKWLKKSKDTNNSLSERIREYTDKVSKKWVSSAKRIRNNPDLNEIGNPIEKSWQQCFREALNDPKVKPFIEEVHENDICVDPVNFTKSI